MRVIFCVLALLVSISFGNLAAEIVKVELDNKEIQQYRGKLGLWVEVSSQSELRTVVARFNSSIEDVNSINDRVTFRSFLFVPFSDEYLKSLKERGIERRVVKSKPDDFIWPIELQSRNPVSSHFGRRNGRLHEGMDIPASRGTPVVAARAGKVTSVGYCSGHGHTVVVRHEDNYFTRYSHNTVNLVKVGDIVQKGQVVGFVGSTGNSTGNHLHFEIRYLDVPLNPFHFMPTEYDITSRNQRWKNNTR